MRRLRYVVWRSHQRRRRVARSDARTRVNHRAGGHRGSWTDCRTGSDGLTQFDRGARSKREPDAQREPFRLTVTGRHSVSGNGR